MWYLAYNSVLTVAFVATLPVVPLIFLLGSRYRDGLAQRFAFYPRPIRGSLARARPVWIHAASVGEVRSAEALVRELKARRPDRKVLLSTFTATGNLVARQIPSVDAIIYLPLDFPWTVRRAFNAFEPSLLVIVETEIWPNLLRGAFCRGIPTVLVSGRLSEKSFSRYSMLRSFFACVLNLFTGLGMQSPADADRVARLGVMQGKVSVVGSLKFAGRPSDKNANEIAAPADPSRHLLVVGSSHKGEEEVLLEAFKAVRARFPSLSLVLAPRHPERFAEVEKLLTGSPFTFQRRTQVADGQYFTRDILLLDSVGELPEFFAAADIAFVGGSLVDRGGHNVLEPARLQKPILFGPHMANFKDIADEMKRRGGAIEVRDAEDLSRALAELLENSDKRKRMGQRASEVAGADRDALMLNVGLAERYL
jgi:3-deoxy-D-manno-octulosonic-acid transferase